MQFRKVDNWTNLLYLAMEYLSLLIAIGGPILFANHRQALGLSWFWNVPVFVTAMILIGGIQHRLAGLGHEASHYCFMKNRFLNDLIPDVFCMFPLMTTVHFYRLFHMAHHQFTNDPERDPDLQNLGQGKRSGEFPMSRSRFIRVIYFAVVVAPMRFLGYLWAYFQVNTLGHGKNFYVNGAESGSEPVRNWPRLGTGLGIVYLLGLNLLTWILTTYRHPGWLIPAGLMGLGLGIVVAYQLPAWAVFHSPFRQAYSSRLGGIFRLAFFTVLMEVLAHLRWATGGASAVYFTLLWLIPLNTSFMYFMFLRDVYQHSNADDGRLTNSRVFFTDPFTRWAVFVYGQDMHIPHHLFPAVPHYRLRPLHDLLKDRHETYRSQVIETHGTFHDTMGRRTILDEMTRPRQGSSVLESQTV
ncbi:MAG: fatty acid desaturase family protein [Isosphaeraceae bacterium]